MKTQHLKVIAGNIYNMNFALSAFNIVPCFKFSINVAYLGFNHSSPSVYVQYKDGKSFLYSVDITEEVLQAFHVSSGNFPGEYVHEHLKGKTFFEVTGEYFVEILSPEEIVDIYNKLQNHYSCTVGLWATDRPDKFENKEFLFEIKGV